VTNASDDDRSLDAEPEPVSRVDGDVRAEVSEIYGQVADYVRTSRSLGYYPMVFERLAIRLAEDGNLEALKELASQAFISSRPGLWTVPAIDGAIRGTVAVTDGDTGTFTDNATVADDPSSLVERAVRHGIVGYSILQLLVLVLICTIVFGLPFLEKSLPAEAAAKLSAEKDGIDFVLALIGAAIVAERKRKQ
jgi:hypothetical protein